MVIAIIVTAAGAIAWLCAAVTLPIAIHRGEMRFWFREVGFIAYCTAFGGVCIAALFWMQAHGWMH